MSGRGKKHFQVFERNQPKQQKKRSRYFYKNRYYVIIVITFIDINHYIDNEEVLL